jgi:hypothetical protein
MNSGYMLQDVCSHLIGIYNDKSLEVEQVEAVQGTSVESCSQMQGFTRKRLPPIVGSHGWQISATCVFLSRSVNP